MVAKQPYHTTPDVTFYVGDALEVLKGLPSESVHCCVTSPPYYGLRNYGVDGQIGLEETPEQFVAKIVEVFGEVKRVLRKDGAVFLNIGDSYWGSYIAQSRVDGRLDTLNPNTCQVKRDTRHTLNELKPKDLVGIPWMVAFALRADGWYLRSEITWCKRAPMPESVTDRPTSATEKLFLLAKSPRYFYDHIAIRQPSVSDHPSGNGFRRDERLSYANGDGTSRGQDEPWQPTATRNLWNYWLLGPEPSSIAHFATFPTKLVEPCILAGTSERGCCPECGKPWERVLGGYYQEYLSAPQETVGWQPSCKHDHEPIPCTVLDCFGGAGTTALVSRQLNRKSVYIDLNPEYADMAIRRLEGQALPLHLEVV